MQYSELKPKQQEFIQWLFDDGNHDEDKTMFQRGYLKRVANDNGMAWAPAWLVKDTGRVSELADFIREASGTASDEDALIERMQDEAVSESESSPGETPVESSATVAA